MKRLLKIAITSFLICVVVSISTSSPSIAKPKSLIERPELAFSKIKIFSKFSDVKINLKPIGDAPEKPNYEICAEEFADCIYSDNFGLKYYTDGKIIGQIKYARLNGVWANGLPWGIKQTDSSKQVYDKLKKIGFKIEGQPKVKTSEDTALLFWLVESKNNGSYWINISFDKQDKIIEFEARGLDW